MFVHKNLVSKNALVLDKINRQRDSYRQWATGDVELVKLNRRQRLQSKREGCVIPSGVKPAPPLSPCGKQNDIVLEAIKSTTVWNDRLRRELIQSLLLGFAWSSLWWGWGGKNKWRFVLCCRTSQPTCTAHGSIIVWAMLGSTYL